jgi:hypothetical protein
MGDALEGLPWAPQGASALALKTLFDILPRGFLKPFSHIARAARTATQTPTK